MNVRPAGGGVPRSAGVAGVLLITPEPLATSIADQLHHRVPDRRPRQRAVPRPTAR